MNEGDFLKTAGELYVLLPIINLLDQQITEGGVSRPWKEEGRR